jgi:hypothetical protein
MELCTLTKGKANIVTGTKGRGSTNPFYDEQSFFNESVAYDMPKGSKTFEDNFRMHLKH